MQAGRRTIRTLCPACFSSLLSSLLLIVVVRFLINVYRALRWCCFIQIENRSCLGLTLATLPGVKVQPFYLADMDVPDPFDPPAVWERAVQLRDADAGQEGKAGVGEPIFLSYSTTTSIDALGDYMAGMDQAFPRSQKIGSIASTVSR